MALAWRRGEYPQRSASRTTRHGTLGITREYGIGRDQLLDGVGLAETQLFQAAFKQPSSSLQADFTHLSSSFQAAFKQLSNNFQAAFKQLSNNFQAAFKQLSSSFQTVLSTNAPSSARRRTPGSGRAASAPAGPPAPRESTLLYHRAYNSSYNSPFK
jgi:hypothetical protein